MPIFVPMRFTFFLLLTSLWLMMGMYAQPYTPGQVYFGTNNYIEYHAGDLPIIVSAPHGGYLAPTSIPDRTFGTTVRDSRTEELAYEIDSAVQVLFGGHPHIIINKLARIKLDANREIVEAAQGNPDAETAWYEFHDFIQAAKDSSQADYGTALYIDLHGHGHTIQRLELGYLISRAEQQLTDAALNAQNFQDTSSILHLKNTLNPDSLFSDLLRGNHCFGEFLQKRGYPSVPSAADPAPGPTDPYFSGGYNTVRHGSRDSSQINAIQIECNWTDVRDTETTRKAFSRALACSFRSYLDHWFFDLDNWDPGDVVTTLADSGPGSLRWALLGAEPGSTLTFSPALVGDTIRLANELRVCTEVTIQGPGAGQLAISGEDSVRILRIMPGNRVAVRDLSLARGHAGSGQDAGAVLAEGSVQLANCTLANNFAEEDGGAVSVTAPDTVWIDSCVVQQNSCADDGGALRCASGTLLITASTIRDNYAASQGGGLSSGGTVSIATTTLSGNEAGSSGGAIRSFGGTVELENSTLSGNLAGNRGAAISTTSVIDLNFCTLVGNTATSLGGGIRVVGGNVTVANSLIANNTGSGDNDVSLNGGAFVSNGHNFIGDTTGSTWLPAVADQLGNTSNPLDPLILPLAANGGPTETHELQAGSPCLNQANPVGTPLSDQRGWIRTYGAQPDIGAYELQPPLAFTPPAPHPEISGDFIPGFRFWPNPAGEVLHLAFARTGDYHIAIGNMLGQTLREWQLKNAAYRTLELDGLPEGSYWLKVSGPVVEVIRFWVLK